jgi:D-proline reductase (dithiol) PrdB
MTTASVTMLPEITRKVRPPRALAVPYPLGYPLGMPVRPGVQRSVLRALLSLCQRDDLPLIESFDERVPR